MATFQRNPSNLGGASLHLMTSLDGQKKKKAFPSQTLNSIKTYDFFDGILKPYRYDSDSTERILALIANS